MRKYKLNKGLELFFEKSKDEVSYFFVLFKGGTQLDNIRQRMHLTEHIITQFDINNKGIRETNRFMGKYKSDAITKKDFVRFQFFVLNEKQLKDRLEVLQLAINNVIIDKNRLEQEKQIVLTEYEWAGLDKTEILDDVNKIDEKDIRENLNTNFTANNLQVYAISKIDKERVIKICNDFAKKLKVSKQNNIFTRTKETVNWLRERIPDLTVPKQIKIEDEIIKTHFKLVAKNNGVQKSIVLNFCLNLDYHNYKEQAKLNAFSLFVADFKYGIKKRLRHELGLVYKTSSELKVSKQQTRMEVVVPSSKENFKQTYKETLKWFKNLQKVGLSDEEFEVLKEDFEYSAFTRPVLEDKENNYYYDKKKYLELIKGLKLNEFNKFIKSVLDKKNMSIVVE